MSTTRVTSREPRARLPRELTLPIVVGIDGSEPAKAALRWAVAAARARRTRVRLVQAYEWALADPYLVATDEAIAAQLRHEAVRCVRAAEVLAREMAAEVEVSTAVLRGPTVKVLLYEGRQAQLTVVGSHRSTTVSAAVLGSVGGALAARAAGPAVIVRPPSGRSAGPTAVVAGVALDATTPAVLAFAFDEAWRRGLPVRAVFVEHSAREVRGDSEPSAHHDVNRRLADALAGWRARYPGVEVHQSVVRDRVASALVATSAAQHLLVVGRHRPHTRVGAFLGSVSQAVLHHAGCPVAVVPLPD